jgi:hypothetical protein
MIHKGCPLEWVECFARERKRHLRTRFWPKRSMRIGLSYVHDIAPWLMGNAAGNAAWAVIMDLAADPMIPASCKRQNINP